MIGRLAGRLGERRYWVERYPLASILIVAVAVRLLFGYPDPGWKADTKRFIAQAQNIAAWEGYSIDGFWSTAIPPGYPVFLASVFALGGSITTARIVQFILSVASCFLLYNALAPVHARRAFWAAGLLAVSPVAAHYSIFILSETFGLFLMSVLVWLLISETTLHPWLRSGAIGLLSMALILTSPAAAFLVAAVIAVGIIQNWRKPATLVAGAVGLLILYVPWQIHQWNATGGIVWRVYELEKVGAGAHRGVGRWIRSWAFTHDHNRAYHLLSGGDALAWAPVWAFDSAEERQIVEGLCEAVAHGGMSPEMADLRLREIGDAHFRSRPLYCRIGLPLLRTAVLWFYLDELGKAQWTYCLKLFPGDFLRDKREVGTARSLQRYGKAVYSTFIVFVNGVFSLIFFWIVLRGFRSGNSMAIGLAVGVTAYVVVGSIQSFHEPRRNIVFYPAILGILAFLPTKRRNEAASETLASPSESSKPKVPLVTVGMTVYNASRFVRETLESWLDQDYPNFELVVSDNASSDGSSDICREYADRDRRIRYVRNETNIGAIRNWNQTLQMARGDYFMWASDHDLFDPTYLSKCVSVLQSEPGVVIAYARSKVIDADGRLMFESGTRLDTRALADPVQRFRHVVWNIKECTMVHGVMRAPLLKRLGGFPDAYSMDDPLLCALSACGTFAQVDEVLYARRENRPQASTDRNMSIPYEIAELDPTRAASRGRKNVRELRRETRNALLMLIARSPIDFAVKPRLMAISAACYWSRYGVGVLGVQHLFRLLPLRWRRSKALRPTDTK